MVYSWSKVTSFVPCWLFLNILLSPSLRCLNQALFSGILSNKLWHFNEHNHITTSTVLVICIIVGKSFGCVDIDIKCKNISISGDMGGRGGGGGSILY